MRTVNDFMSALQEYFGPFPNKTVAYDIATEVGYIKPSDLPVLLRQIKITLPASWSPDLKSIVDAIKAAKIESLSLPGNDRQCPVCQTKWNSTGICPTCAYAGTEDGTPGEYRDWWESWKAGNQPHFHIGETLHFLARSKTLPESGK